MMNAERNELFLKEKLIIIGASGHGKVVADIAIKMNKWQSIVFLDDNESTKECLGLDVIGTVANAINFKDGAEFFVAIGNNAIREKVQEDLISKKLPLATLIHPNAVIGTEVEVGVGTAIMAGVVINSSTKVGKGCIINTSSSLDHDNLIEDYVHISPGAHLAGTVWIQKGSWIGIGSAISNSIIICGKCIVGAGAVVVKDITSPGVYIGVPVKKIE